MLWQGDADWLPAIPAWASGLIRPRSSGAFGVVLGRTRPDFSLLVSRWDEVEASGQSRCFAGSVGETERGADDLNWVIDRLRQAHSFTCLRPANWERIEEATGLQLRDADNEIDRRRCWERLFARLHDSHTRLISLEGPNGCPRVHCGVYGEFVDPRQFRIGRVMVDSAAAEAGLAPGDRVLGGGR